jgi:RNA polymerase sigma-70 factor (ECF subfamily)
VHRETGFLLSVIDSKQSNPDDCQSDAPGNEREKLNAGEQCEAALNERIEGLIKPARRGDDAAWSALVECLYPGVIAIVRAHRPYSESEEDLAQDIFVKVFMKLDRYRGKTPLTHWVSRIALNTCYDRLRTQKSRRVHSYSDLDIEDPESIEQLSSAASFTHRDSLESPRGTIDLLNRLIATLSPDQQLVIRLLDLDERSVAEVCGVTGWGQSKVKVTAMRARRKLTEALEQLESAQQPDSEE